MKKYYGSGVVKITYNIQFCFIIVICSLVGVLFAEDSLVNSKIAHDDCAQAIEVAVDVPYVGSTVGATGQDITSCADDDFRDVWHLFTAEKNAAYIISLCNSTFDTTLSVFSGCGNLEIECNDDYCDTQSQIMMDMTAGQQYLIRISGYDGATGAYTLDITEYVCLPPDPAYQPLPIDGSTEVDINTGLAWNGQMLPEAKPKPSSDKTIKLIYGDDDRFEQYEVFDQALLAAGDATVAIVSSSMLSDNGNGIYHLPAETFAEYYLNVNNRPLCEDERFRDQPNPAWCSGFLVAPDIIATAGHCISESNDCTDVAFIFGFVMQDSSTAVTAIDASEIYYCSEIIDRVETNIAGDWALIRLDRPVLNHRPLPIRRTGIVNTDESLVIIGHPMGLPRKYSSNATVKINSELTYFQTNTDSYAGNSGSVVLNSNTMQVEGIFVRGNRDFVEDGSCDRSNVCPDDGGCSGLYEDVVRATEFSSGIPTCDVYLSDDPTQLELVAADVISDTFKPNTLKCGTTYYWQIISKNCGQTSSPIFSFTTAPAGDLNADCKVTMPDLALFANKWKVTNCNSANNFCNGADIDKNGTVNLADLTKMAENWMTTIKS